jgi:hypothetical protein
MAAEYIDDTETGSGLYPTKIPGYEDAADIQEALRLYHYGSTTIPTQDVLGSVPNGINTKSIAGYFKAIDNTIETLATEEYVIDAIEAITGEYSELAGVGIDWNENDQQFDISNSLLLVSPKEKTNISSTPATGIVNIDIVTASVNIITSNATGNYTINVRGDSTNTLNSLMSVGESITVTFESPNGSTAYYATGYTVDGNSVTPKWLGGTAPSVGNVNSTDLYMLQIRKTADATFTCLASLSKFV